MAPLVLPAVLVAVAFGPLPRRRFRPFAPGEFCDERRSEHEALSLSGEQGGRQHVLNFAPPVDTMSNIFYLSTIWFESVRAYPAKHAAVFIACCVYSSQEGRLFLGSIACPIGAAAATTTTASASATAIISNTTASIDIR